jgi:hypothetical protein
MRRPPSRVSLAAALAALAVLVAAGAQAAQVIQKHHLRVATSATMRPRALPRKGAAPISVSIAGHITSTDEKDPPALEALSIEINRHGRLEYAGLPACSIGQIQPASSEAAYRACHRALVGQGRYLGTIALPGAAPYPIEGRLLLFNGREHGHEVLLGHIFSAKPFVTSFVMTFRISALRHGTYGSVFSTNLAKSLGPKRTLTGIEMTLSRRYSHRGARRSYLSAGCPAPKGFSAVPFALARTTFDFAGGRKMTSTLTQQCRVRG